MSCFDSKDILSNIVCHLPFSSLLDMMTWDSPSPGVSLLECKLRIFDLLSWYMPRLSCPLFFESLETCQGAIVGELPMRLFSDIPLSLDSLPALEIAVRCGLNDPLNTFFEDRGYTSTIDIPEDYYKGSVDLVERFIRKGNNRVRMLSHRAFRPFSNLLQHVSVLVSKNRALEIVLAAPTTAGMTAISPTHLLSFYPELTQSREALTVGGRLSLPLKDTATLPPSFSRTTTNSHWKAPCGNCCPQLWRKSMDDEGVLRQRWYYRPRVLIEKREVAWGAHGQQTWVQDTSDLTYSQALLWRVLARCENPHCSHQILHQARSKFVLV